MKKNRRIISFVTILIIIVSLLLVISGCTQKHTAKKAAVDLGGYKFTWATMWEWNNYPEAGASDYGDKRLELYKKIEKEYNCKIEKITVNPETFFDQVNKAVMAGDKFADFVEVDFGRYQVLHSSNSLQALNKIEGFDTVQEKYFDSISKAYTDSKNDTYGLQYQLPHLVTGGTGTMVFFNKDMLAKNNLESPYDLVKNKKWNFDEFAKMVKALTKDTNGDNEIDQWGMGTIDWHFNSLEKPLIFANGGSVIRKNSDDKWQFDLLSPQAQQALNFISQLEIKDKVLAPQSTTSSPSDSIDYFTSGKVGFYFTTSEMIDRINKNFKGSWGCVPIPIGPSAKDYTQAEISLRAWVMLVTNKEAKNAATVFDAISEPVTGSVKSDEDLFYDNFLNNMLNGDKDALTMLKLATSKMVPDNLWGCTAATTPLNTALQACLRDGGMTPKAAMEAVAPVVQGYIEGFFYPTEQTSSVPTN